MQGECNSAAALALESWGQHGGAQRSQENPVAKQCREPGGKGVPDFIVKHITKISKEI